MKLIDAACILMLLIVVLIGGYFYPHRDKPKPLTNGGMKGEVKKEHKGHIAKELCSTFECQQKYTEAK